jgi:hypothetical protein
VEPVPVTLRVRRTVRMAVALVVGQALLCALIGWLTLGRSRSEPAHPPGSAVVDAMAAPPTSRAVVAPTSRVIVAPTTRAREATSPTARSAPRRSTSAPAARSTPPTRADHRPARGPGERPAPALAALPVA